MEVFAMTEVQPPGYLWIFFSPLGIQCIDLLKTMFIGRIYMWV